jgi:glycosyltransferase involved in cell wall biosynthesis
MRSPASGSEAASTECSLTVVMTTYNHRRYVAQALEGIFRQSIFGAIRVLVSDDGSADGSAELASSLADGLPNVTVRRNAENIGVVEHWLGLIRTIETPYVAILDGDDYWTSPDRLRDLLSFLGMFPDVNCAFTACTPVDAGGRQIMPRRPQFFGGRRHGFLYFEDVLDGNPITTYSNCMYRTDMLRQVMLHESRREIYDWPVNLLIASRGPVGYLDGDYGAYRVHEDGMWSGLTEEEQNSWIRRCLEVVRPQVSARHRHAIDNCVWRRYRGAEPGRRADP